MDDQRREEERRQRNETKEQTMLQHVRELEEKLTLQIVPQRQQPERISELTLEQHDQLLLFNLFTDDRTLEKKVCENLPIVEIVDSMGSFVPQKYKMNVKQITVKNGSYAANKRFLTLATVRKLKAGWSCQLLQTIAKMDLKDMEELISPKQADLENFNKRIGIPSNSLLHQITDELRDHCGILISPMGKKDIESELVPVVHPQLCVSEEHFTQNTAFTDGTYKPSEAGRQAYKDAPRISFNAITKSNVQTPESAFSKLLRKHHGLSLFFIGPAGSGKTTLTKRLVKTWVEENKIAILIPFAQVDKDQRLSLKYLLTEFVCRFHNLEHTPNEEEIDQAFQWILTNQDKCLLIFDGLDQSSFEISNQPIVGDINGEFFPADLMSFLLSRKFLPNCRLVVTSRPHTLVQFSHAIQPDIVVFLNDLLSDDVEKLMNHYLEHGTADEIMQKLRIKSPRIHQLIFNPLFLRLVAMLNNEVGEEIWTYVNTTAKLFYEVIDRLQMSAHHECGLNVDDVKVLNLKLGEMALDKTMKGSVIFEKKDLEKYGLTGENIQDFLFGIVKSSFSKHNCSLLVGLMVFYFNHQTTQEFFSARFAVEKLPLDEFKSFVERIFPRMEKSKRTLQVGEDSFATLRVLVFGCINEINSQHLDGGEILEKKNLFLRCLCDHLGQLFVKGSASAAVTEHQKQMLVDLLDFREEEVVDRIREHLKGFDLCFNYSGSRLNVAAHREGFFHTVQNFTSKVERLWLNIEEWSVVDIRKLFHAIKHSSPKIEDMRIWMKPPHIPNVNDVVEILPHLTGKLAFTLVIKAGSTTQRLFCRKLKKEIIIKHLETLKIQTEELIVQVRDSLSTYLLVEFRPGEPPEFVTERF